MNELSALLEAIAATSIYFKAEIVVSYIKSHSLRIEWIEANPALAKIVTSGLLKTFSLETLFEANRNNKNFLRDVENHISKQLLAG